MDREDVQGLSWLVFMGSLFVVIEVIVRRVTRRVWSAAGFPVSLKDFRTDVAPHGFWMPWLTTKDRGLGEEYARLVTACRAEWRRKAWVATLALIGLYILFLRVFT